MQTLRVLLAESSDDDAALVERELARAFDVRLRRVRTAAELAAALGDAEYDVVIAADGAPPAGVAEALGTLRDRGADAPWIVASRSADEEAVVQAMRLGARDYVLMDRLARLVPAVERELRDSERRRARGALGDDVRSSEARFRDLFETAPDGILAVDGEGTIVLANAAAEGMFGYEKLIGEPLELLVPHAVRGAHVEHRSRFFAKPSRRKTGGGRSLEGLRKDGSAFPVEVSLGPSAVDGRPVVLAIVRDMTDRAALEQRFLQSQKLEAIGRLAAGVAHDFNNLLSVVLSYGALILGELEPTDPMRNDVQEIHAAATRASVLTRQLLAFGRRQILTLQPTDLGAVLANVESMLRRVLGEDIELTILAKPDLGTVVVDPGQIEQVVMNLVVNARDAMPTGGKLTLETTNVTLDRPYAVKHGVPRGAYVMLAVTDTGTGMTAETQARLFEPFFTTKERGKGTGLGLSTVFGIVQQSGGHIWFYSEPGQGTTFKIYFPRKDDAETATSSPPPTPTRRGTETILLVEDDDSLRGVATTILRRQGYHVLAASTGGDALVICEQHGAKIHLLLTDVIMPRMSGRELADRLKAIRPDMKLLFMSGYTDDSIVHHGVLDPGVAFLQKPITPESLARKVRQILDE